MHAELTLGISQVNYKVNFNLCMEKLALNDNFSLNCMPISLTLSIVTDFKDNFQIRPTVINKGISYKW